MTISSQIKTHHIQSGLKPIKGIKNIIAVASGKGGVGKSTIAANLACSLQQCGARVGLLDADIYGPSQAKMLSSGQAITKPQVTEQTKFEPFVRHHVQMMSMAYLVEEKQAAIWRGPMVSKALMQLLLHTAWDNLDYLILDLPPGTGDIQLTMAKQIPVTAALIVTTPQDIALVDVYRAINMFEKVNVPTLGIVENMSYHVCGHCQHQSHIFGQGGGEKIARDTSIPLLAQIPLHEIIMADADQGIPFVINHPDHPGCTPFIKLAEDVDALVAQYPVSYTQKFPNVVQK